MSNTGSVTLPKITGVADVLIKPANPESPLATKIAKIMAEIERIPKNGEIKGKSKSGAEYSYPCVLAGDVFDAVRTQLGKAGIALLPTMTELTDVNGLNDKGLPVTLGVRVGVDFLFVDGESGERVERRAYGVGLDSGDKAISKAMTQATKTLITNTFLISAGEPEGVRPKQQRQQASTQTATTTTTGDDRPREFEATVRDVRIDQWQGKAVARMKLISLTGNELAASCWHTSLHTALMNDCEGKRCRIAATWEQKAGRVYCNIDKIAPIEA